MQLWNGEVALNMLVRKTVGLTVPIGTIRSARKDLTYAKYRLSDILEIKIEEVKNWFSSTFYISLRGEQNTVDAFCELLKEAVDKANED